jgi:hypothetical protein
MEKQTTKVVHEQSCREGVSNYLVEEIKAKDAEIESLRTQVNEWENRAISAEVRAQCTAEELVATKDELHKQQVLTNEWENRSIQWEEAFKETQQALKEAQEASKEAKPPWWKRVLFTVGNWIFGIFLLFLSTIFGKAIENSSPKVIGKASSLISIDETLSIAFEYAAMLWQAVRVFLGN